MTTITIAYRNIFRNRRRSIMTMLAIIVSAMAVVLFGGYVAMIMLQLETEFVRRSGHLQIFRAGYFDFGAGQPEAFGIGGYAALIDRLRADLVLAPKLRVVTSTLAVTGIAGNFAEDASKTVFAQGQVPSERERMRHWDDYGVGSGRHRTSALSDDDVEGGVIGIGVARMLFLCDDLGVNDCPAPPADLTTRVVTAQDVPDEDFSDLTALDAVEPAHTDPRPKLDLLAATAGGAPNVVSLAINRAESQGNKVIDDNFIAMHLTLAQRLVFGRGTPKVTAVVLQLVHTADMAAARAYLTRLFVAEGLPLEVRDFKDLNPRYGQITGLFRAIFTFIALIMGVIVVFTVVNTMTMSVMERITEIGTLRALGLRRGGVRRLFVAEGLMLGMIGASLGVGLALAAAAAINGAGLTWLPPGNADPVDFKLVTVEAPQLVLSAWVLLMALAALSSLLPANKAARMPVVDALRHV